MILTLKDCIRRQFTKKECFADHRPHGRPTEFPVLSRSESTSEFQPLEDKEVEYFFASDASAVVEHTNRVIFLEVITFFLSSKEKGFYFLVKKN